MASARTDSGSTIASRTRRGAAAFRLPPAPSAAAAGTSTVTGPFAAGAMVAVYAAPDPRRSDTVPLPTRTSAASNPVTGSLNVIVTTNAPPTTGGAAAATSTRAGPASLSSICKR